jgi:D-alanyl-D-alanine dipeptidase
MINFDGGTNVPPHCTGAALDLYLVNQNAEPYEMGIHPKDWMKDENGALSLTQSEIISPEAQKNRSIMGRALNSVGFVNYPTEYWHWSYGDRYWAYVKHKAYAIYGTISK